MSFPMRVALKISFSRNDASREMKNTYWLDLTLSPVLQLWGDSPTHPRGRRETCRADLPQLKQLQLSPTHYRGPSWLKNTWEDPAKMNWTMCQLWSIIINGYYFKPVSSSGFLGSSSYLIHFLSVNIIHRVDNRLMHANSMYRGYSTEMFLNQWVDSFFPNSLSVP